LKGALDTGHVRVSFIKEQFLIFFMAIVKKNLKKWEISLMEYENGLGKKYKVTKRVPDMTVAETKVFRSKEEAKKQFDEWLE
jgi:hypothetical protein